MSSRQNSREWSIRTAVAATSLTLLSGIGAVTFTAALAAIDGVWGLYVGLLVFGAALASPGPAAFAVAQLGVVSLVPASEAWPLVATQCAAFPLLASAAYGRSPDRQRLGRLGAAYVAALGAVWTLQTNFRWLWHAALAIAVLVAAVAYALHRYERVTVGLVTRNGGDDNAI